MKKYFSLHNKPVLDLPNLSEIQLNSYRWFLEKGLKELFSEVTPIRGYSGKELALELVFGEYYADQPKFSETHAKEHNLSYEAPLRAKVQLVNKKTNEVKEQEVYLGDFPLMTERGTFIVNGVERVIVSQLIRSSGVYFVSNHARGRKYFGAKIIPNRGAWFEFETDMDGSINVRIDRKRKISATALLRIFGMEKNDDIIDAFKDVDTGEVSYIKKTLDKDQSKSIRLKAQTNLISKFINVSVRESLRQLIMPAHSLRRCFLLTGMTSQAGDASNSTSGSDSTKTRKKKRTGY